MEDFLNRVAEAVAARLSGPMNFRFIFQPIMAIVLGIRAGIQDAHAGSPAFLADLILRKEGRKASLKGAWKHVRWPIVLGAVLDAVAQWILFHHIRPLPALFVGFAVIALPYGLARGLTNRIVSVRMRHKGTPVTRAK